MIRIFSLTTIFFVGSLLFMSCNNTDTTKTSATEPTASEAPEYFNLRPKL